MSRSSSLDRIVGLASTVVVGGVVILALHSWLKKVIVENRSKKRKDKGDDVYNSRYSAMSSSPNTINVIHNGSCHCHRVKFRIKASKVLNAVDIPSKIRYPRVTISSKNFESLTEDGIMSLYAIKEKGIDDNDNMTVGIHTFCSFCGVHVFYSPSIDPFEIQVNLDCIDRSNIDKVNISYMGVPESVPFPISYEAARQYSKRGIGCSFSPNINALVPFVDAANTPMSTVYALTRYDSASNRKYDDNFIDNNNIKKKSSPTGFSLSNYLNMNNSTPENKNYDKENINNNKNMATNTPNKFQYPSFLTPAKYKGTKKILGAKDQNSFLTMSTPVQNQLRQHLQHHLQPKII